MITPTSLHEASAYLYDACKWAHTRMLVLIDADEATEDDKACAAQLADALAKAEQ